MNEPEVIKTLRSFSKREQYKILMRIKKDHRLCVALYYGLVGLPTLHLDGIASKTQMIPKRVRSLKDNGLRALEHVFSEMTAAEEAAA